MEERENIIAMHGNPLTLLGPAIEAGQPAPDFKAVGNDLSEISLSDYKGKAVVISVVPSLDTPVCDVQTRKFNEEKLRTETEKLRVGKSTSFLVAQAQRDLLVSRIAEVQALANYLKALIDLYRQDGSLLERRRISAPGREPVNLSTSPQGIP